VGENGALGSLVETARGVGDVFGVQSFGLEERSDSAGGPDL
jgi:hypothetical protein